MALPCDADTGYNANGRQYYEFGLPQAPETFTDTLKAFTTNKASLYMLENRLDFNWGMVEAVSAELAAQNLGSMYVKGGLALHIVIKKLMKTWRTTRSMSDVAVMRRVEEYLHSKYSAPSDLDTGIDLHDQADLARVTALLKQTFQRKRRQFSTCDQNLQHIVDDCNADAASILGNDKFQAAGVVDVEFIVAPQHDRLIETVDAQSAPDCVHPKCVAVQSGSTAHCVFESDNESLYFTKGASVADFYLYRLKWSVGAVLTLADGSTCKSNCPAELLDVAIPRTHDTRLRKNADAGMSLRHADIDIDTVRGLRSVSAVDLRYQLIDLREMIQESVVDFATTATISDAKIGKRIFRFFVLMVLKDAEREEPFDKRPTSWAELLGSRDLHEVIDFMDALIAAQLMEDDVDLFEHLCDLRMLNRFGGGGTSGRRAGVLQPTAAVACVLITLAMAVLGGS